MRLEGKGLGLGWGRYRRASQRWKIVTYEDSMISSNLETILASEVTDMVFVKLCHSLGCAEGMIQEGKRMLCYVGWRVIKHY